jgi:K+/H+ antiporter YhaU regulatory subunit KhtT
MTSTFKLVVFAFRVSHLVCASALEKRAREEIAKILAKMSRKTSENRSTNPFLDVFALLFSPLIFGGFFGKS